MVARADSGSPAVVYGSRYLHEVDLVAEELEQAGISTSRSREDPMGYRFQIAAAAAAVCLPGSRYIVVVQGADVERARALVATLPVSHDE